MDQWAESPAPKRFFGEEALVSKEKLIAAYNGWTEQVKRDVPEEKLLIFHPAQGWKPLCEFLGVPVPDVPFPRSNARKAMHKRRCFIVFFGILQLIFFPILIVSWIVFWWRDGFRDVERKEAHDDETATTLEINDEECKTKNDVLPSESNQYENEQEIKKSLVQ